MNFNKAFHDKTGLFGLLMSVLLPLVPSCGLFSGKGDSGTVATRDTLHAVTLYGPTSYFIYRGEEMGFEYENLRQFASDNDMELDLKIAPSMQSLLKMLKEGEAQLAAYPVPRIEEYKGKISYCGANEVTKQVLVQPAGENLVSDVTQLIGDTVYVEKDSKYHYRLQNLNNELGGGIEIRTMSTDSLTAEDLIEMVNSGKIPLTVVDSDIAEINKSYFPKLDIGMELGLEQYASWAVGNGSSALKDKIDNWNRQRKSTLFLREIYRKYFEISKTLPSFGETVFMQDYKPLANGDVSEYDALFKKAANGYGIDWLFLASIAYNESRFNQNLVSWAGAIGLMQLMPVTAKAMGVEPEKLQFTENNIEAAARLVSHIDKKLKQSVPDDFERMKFIAAAYNGGLGHITDAINLAKKYGLNPSEWLGNVGEAVSMKSRPQYYNDQVVKNGYFRGRETLEFVDRVMYSYNIFKSLNKT